MNSSFPEKYLNAVNMTRAVQTRSSNKDIKNTPDEDDVMLRFSILHSSTATKETKETKETK